MQSNFGDKNKQIYTQSCSILGEKRKKKIIVKEVEHQE
jgi:hypothetical protein